MDLDILDTIDTIDTSFITSFIYLTNSVVSFYMGYYTYSLLLLFLSSSSILYRLIPLPSTYLLDRACVYAVIGCGAYIFYVKSYTFTPGTTLFIISTFIATIYLFTYGYMTKTMCFHTDEKRAKNYQSLLHIISSIGHHCISLF